MDALQTSGVSKTSEVWYEMVILKCKGLSDMADDAAIEEILAGHSATVIELVNRLRELVRQTDPELVEEPKKGWSNITYRKKGVVCAISPHKTHVNLHFYKGASLTDPDGLLEGSGKALRHVEVTKPEDIQGDKIAHLVREAVQLDAA